MSRHVSIPRTRRTDVTSGGSRLIDLYVSTAGSDTGGDGSESRPWATPDKARSVIRSSGINLTSNVVVNIQPGNYWDTTLELEAADSGATGKTVTYRSNGTGLARLLGGTRITSWTLHSGSIYRASLSAPIYTLYENGERARKARLPKSDPGDFPASYAPYFITAGVNDSFTVLQYNPVDFDPAAWTLADIQIVCWPGGDYFSSNVVINWFTDTHPVTARDTTAKTFTLANDGMKFPAFRGGDGARYFVQGPLQLLTEPGEFVVTSDGASGYYLYYWARDGAIADQEIVAPTTKRVVSMVGTDNSTRVQNVVLDGLTIECSDFDSWYRFGTKEVDYTYWAQLPHVRQGLVYLENTSNVTIRNCHLKNAGFAGVYMWEYGQQNIVENCWIEHTGTDCIYLEGQAPGDGDIMKSNRFWNCILNNFGELAGNGMGIQVNQSGSNQISHIDASVGPRNGIRITGWTDVDPTSDMYARSNVISYCKVHETNQDSQDAGAIGLSFFTNVGVQYVYQCIVDDIEAEESVTSIPPDGCFNDNQSNGQVYKNVQVTDVQGELMRSNDSTGHVLTNCSFQADGSANPGFNPALMDTANIGIIAGNPYS